MKVKNKCIEFADWKTVKQWAKDGYVIINQDETVTLWANQYCKQYSVYAAPDNVRPMTALELSEYQEKERERAREKRAEKKIAKEIYCKKNEYADKLRKEWHTKWQWLNCYHRRVNENAICRVGKTLNNDIGRNWQVFSPDYCYFNIKDTTLVTDET